MELRSCHRVALRVGRLKQLSSVVCRVLMFVGGLTVPTTLGACGGGDLDMDDPLDVGVTHQASRSHDIDGYHRNRGEAFAELLLSAAREAYKSRHSRHKHVTGKHEHWHCEGDEVQSELFPGSAVRHSHDDAVSYRVECYHAHWGGSRRRALVVAFRGSRVAELRSQMPPSPTVHSHRFLWDSSPRNVHTFSKWIQQIKKVEVFVASVLRASEGRVVFTGHSMGGGIAQLMGWARATGTNTPFYDAVWGRDTQVVSFNAPRLTSRVNIRDQIRRPKLHSLNIIKSMYIERTGDGFQTYPQTWPKKNPVYLHTTPFKVSPHQLVNYTDDEMHRFAQALRYDPMDQGSDHSEL